MSWNIQNLGVTKMGRDIVLECIAQTVINNKIDLLIIVELRNILALHELSNVLTALCSKMKGTPSADYSRFYSSPKAETGTIYNGTSHSEYYGFIVKDVGAVKSFGFPGAKGPDEYLFTTSAGLKFGELSGNTQINGERITNSFYLYNGTPPAKSRSDIHHFPGGRPPCWAQFQLGNIQLNVIVVHLRPELNTAIAQMNELLLFDVVQATNQTQTLIITGDFNTESGTILSREAKATADQIIAKEYEKVGCFATFTRKSQSTHVSGSVYDNFFIRKAGNILKNIEIVQISEILDTLTKSPGCDAAIKEWIKEYLNRKDFKEDTAQLRKDILSAVTRSKKLNAEQGTELFKIISDHYPIICEVA